MSELVSIIVPVYNTERYLERNLNSIIGQSYRELEIILINDCSTDRSSLICRKYADTDKRIIYLERELNGGLGAARNDGLEVVKGKYISFIDSDDYIDPDFIQILFNACKIHSSDVSMCAFSIVNDQSTIYHLGLTAVNRWSSKEALEKLLVWKDIDGSVCNKLFNSSLFTNRRFPTERISEDLPVTVNILCTVNHIVHVGCPLYYYVKRSGSITNQGFSVKKMTILDSAYEVKETTLQFYPSLRNHADYYYNSHLIYLLDLIESVTERHLFREEFRYLKKQVRNSILQILTSPYFSMRKKVKAILLLTGISSHTIRRL